MDALASPRFVHHGLRIGAPLPKVFQFMNTASVSNTSANASRLPPPLRTSSDMRSDWSDVELDFDTAAERIVQAHSVDGEQRDLCVSDLRTWAIAPHEGCFGLVPLSRHHAVMPLRANGFSNLATRLGAPVEFIRRLPAPLQLATLNYLLAQSSDGSAAMLRLRNNEVSAIVSERYAPLDPRELMTTIGSALGHLGIRSEVRVRAAASGLVDNLRIILPAEAVPVRPGDVSAVGLDITASSFGRSNSPAST